MEKIKGILKGGLESEKGKDILVVIIVILVGLISFELGRLSINQSSGVKIEYQDQEANFVSAAEFDSSVLQKTTATISIASKSTLGKAFFASSRGHKYYSIGCSAGKTIVQENRIYFNTESEAQKAGYEKSASCK